MLPTMLATSLISARLRRGSGGCLRPVQAELFKVGGRRQFFGDDKRMLRRRVAAALAVGHGGHGRHTDFGQTLNGVPLLTRTKHRQFGGEQVLDDLAPANTAVDLDEIAAPIDFGAQRAAAFQLAINLALQSLDGNERIATGPQAFKGFSQYQLHGRAARMMSAACCGMEYRSALSA